MADPRNNPKCATGSNMFKEAVCIDTDRIYDSVTDKDCIEDLRVYFTNIAQNVIDHATTVKCTDVKIINAYMDVEQVPFNKGFYSVDMTFFFAVTVSALTSPMAQPTMVTGVAIFQKKVILYGSEGSVKTFTSQDPRNCPCQSKVNDPKAMLQVVDPICLSLRLDCCPCNCEESGCELPPCMCGYFEGDFCGVHPRKKVFVTLGLFTIVQMERNVQMMIPAYDFCIPDKESVSSGAPEDPCALFKRLKFPTDEFFPPRLADIDC